MVRNIRPFKSVQVTCGGELRATVHWVLNAQNPADITVPKCVGCATAFRQFDAKPGYMQYASAVIDSIRTGANQVYQPDMDFLCFTQLRAASPHMGRAMKYPWARSQPRELR